MDIGVTFELLFAPEQLGREFESRFSKSQSRGLDRRSGAIFSRTAAAEFQSVAGKCLKGNYRFTPYLENLRIKDRRSAPRLISIPSIRDRVVLLQLNKLLRLCFPAESQTPLASEYIRNIASNVASLDTADTWTCGRDVKKFYDSINREKLLKRISKQIPDERIITLVRRAIYTPTVPKIYRSKDLKKYRSTVGIPQGLAISNSLAAIYMFDVDEAMKMMPIQYYRFVDDVLLIGSKDETLKAARSFAARVRSRGLSIHRHGPKQGHHLPLLQSFSYLGYVFQLPSITVREATLERLLQSLASKITEFKYNKDKLLQKRPYLTDETLLEAFIDELNEKISGAVSDSRRYGWIAYFSLINDHTVLHRLDHFIAQMIARQPTLSAFHGRIKRFARAYFEMKFRPTGGYVRNYDVFKTPVQMLRFLVFRGQVDEKSRPTEQEIVSRFESYKLKQLSSMLADEGRVY